MNKQYSFCIGVNDDYIDQDRFDDFDDALAACRELVKVPGTWKLDIEMREGPEDLTVHVEVVFLNALGVD